MFAAPSISWVPNDNWTVLGEMEFIQQKIPFDTGLIAVEDEFPLPASTFLGEPALGKTRLQALTTSFNVEYKRAELWGLSAKLLWQGSDIDGFRAEPDELDDENSAGEFLLSRAVQHESDDSDGFSAQFEFSRKISAARVAQQILAGYEYVRVDNHVVLSESDVEEDAFEIDIFDVVYGLNSPALAALRETDEVLHQHSVYLHDFISLGDKLRVLLGTRLDRIEIDINDIFIGTDVHQSDTELSSRAGLVYAVNSMLSLFVGYGESLDPNEGLTPQGSPLKPSGGKSVEGGIKFRHPFMNLSVDASLFSIEKTNVTVDAPGAPGFEIQTARQKSDGFDMLMSFSPAAWLHSNISYAYTDAEIFDDPELADGTQPINVPLHKLVLSSFISLRIRSENDLQAGLSFSYRSAQKASLDPDELTVKLPGYWLGDLFVNYTLSPRISLGLNINASSVEFMGQRRHR